MIFHQFSSIFHMFHGFLHGFFLCFISILVVADFADVAGTTPGAAHGSAQRGAFGTVGTAGPQMA